MQCREITQNTNQHRYSGPKYFGGQNFKCESFFRGVTGLGVLLEAISEEWEKIQ